MLHNTILDREGFERHLQAISEECIENNALATRRPKGRITSRTQFIRDTFKDYVNTFTIRYDNNM